jgi:polysaccharide export outer membrane protein
MIFPKVEQSKKLNTMNTIKTSFRSWSVIKLAGVLLAAATGLTGKIAAEPSHSERIILREGDILKITFPGSGNLDTIQPIRRDGKLNLPLVGEVDASGMTPDDLQKKLVTLYSSQISTKEVTVQVQSSTFPVFVTGEVLHPGKILSDHPITALEAVMEAGGFNYNTANLKAVKIVRNKNGVMEHYTVNLKAVLAGDATKPFYLEPQDIVYVSERFSVF